MTQPQNKDRRRFLLTTSAATLAAGTLAAGCGGGSMGGDAGSTGPVTVGDVPVGTFRYGSQDINNHILARDAMGFYAYSNTCTHMQCIVPLPVNGTSTCPCHLSQYDTNGHVTRPAAGVSSQPDLAHYAVTFSGTGDTATITVDQSMTVDPSMRYPAP